MVQGASLEVLIRPDNATRNPVILADVLTVPNSNFSPVDVTQVSVMWSKYPHFKLSVATTPNFGK